MADDANAIGELQSQVRSKQQPALGASPTDPIEVVVRERTHLRVPRFDLVQILAGLPDANARNRQSEEKDDRDHRPDTGLIGPERVPDIAVQVRNDDKGGRRDVHRCEQKYQQESLPTARQTFFDFPQHADRRFGQSGR